MEDTAATRLVQRPNGTQLLLLRQARLRVTEGPDRGRELLMDRPRVVVGSGEGCDLVLADAAVSREHLEVRATERGYLLKDLESTNGTLVGGVWLREALAVGPAALRLGETVLQLVPTAETVEIPLSSRGQLGDLLGQSVAMRQVFAVLERVAPTGSTVLLEGESGTGKEVAARAIHALSPRAEGPLVVVDSGAIPASLIESELFGHEKGAFTGANEARAGAFEEADGGTLFLDEIGELPLELQPRLLRFLERQEVKRVGAARHRPVDVRVVAATNRKLAGEVEAGRFRQDLFYRLSVVRLELPPLRERPDDIVLLAYHFAERFGPDPRQIVTDEVAALLVSYPWPGNARELRNVVERLAVMPELAAEELRQSARPPAPAAIGSLGDLAFHEARTRWQDLFEQQYLAQQLSRAGGVVSHAAATAGLPRQTFHRLMRRHGLKGR